MGALRRTRGPLVAVALVQVLSVAAGAIAVHAGVPWALDERDRVVGTAQGTATLRALDEGHRWRAAGLDLAANALLGGVATGLTGITIVAPFAIDAYRGWIGGIVSVDARHESRLAEPASELYYLSVVLLQSAGFVLCSAGGVRAGLSWLRPTPLDRASRPWAGVPRSGLRDMGVLMALSLPFFVVGSLVEFLAAS